MSATIRSRQPAKSPELATIRAAVGSLPEPNRGRYWTDFLLTWLVGVVSFRMVRIEPLGIPTRLVAFALSCLLFYRAALFIHELAHLPQRRFRLFRTTWNVLCGIPFLMPSFLYESHLDHHRTGDYGTDRDGEYLAFARGPRRWVFTQLVACLVVPPLAVVRFAILGPLSWCFPWLAEWTYRHASSLVVDPNYVRPLHPWIGHTEMRLLELGCFLYLAAVATLVMLGIVPWFAVAQIYATAVVVLLLNTTRTLGAHRWQGTGEAMTHAEQMVDSVNYPAGSWWLIPWAPLGLRFHALHHLLPAIPYHALADVHRKLMRELPADSPYQRCASASPWRVWRELLTAHSKTS